MIRETTGPYTQYDFNFIKNEADIGSAILEYVNTFLYSLEMSARVSLTGGAKTDDGIQHFLIYVQPLSEQQWVSESTPSWRRLLAGITCELFMQRRIIVRFTILDSHRKEVIDDLRFANVA